MARGTPTEPGRRITQPELSRRDAPVILVKQILEAQSIVWGRLDMAKARYHCAIEKAAKRSGTKQSKFKTNASAILDSSTHVVEKDRPFRRRPPTRRVIAAILTQEQLARRVCAEHCSRREVFGIETRQPGLQEYIPRREGKGWRLADGVPLGSFLVDLELFKETYTSTTRDMTWPYGPSPSWMLSHLYRKCGLLWVLNNTPHGALSGTAGSLSSDSHRAGRVGAWAPPATTWCSLS
eukprot:6214267-Pleurochrysis_carterae.AAC.3